MTVNLLKKSTILLDIPFNIDLKIDCIIACSPDKL